MPKNHTYYWTCPYCGSNLDPGEKCDCQKIKTHDMVKNHENIDNYKSVDRGGVTVVSQR